MQTVGVLGGVACGKSLVTRQFAQLGAGVVDADRLGHAALDEPEVRAALSVRWGGGVFLPDGTVHRKRVAEIVFDPAEEGAIERAFLERVVHPWITRGLEEAQARLRSQEYRVVVLDAPLLLEAGWDRLCSKLVFVDAPRQLRLARATSRGWTEEDVARREAAQVPLEVKRRRADVTIDNSGTPRETQAQVERLWESLVE
ncbi:MAG: dephospho-CoA kinase [Patescibacteria group bacterium]|nr:dephospho-CoA kinase [Patescibacteria group bacterium]